MKPIKKVSVTPIDPITGSIVDGTNIDDKATNTYSAEIIDGLVAEVGDKIIIETHIIATDVSFSANSTKTYSVPAKNGYRAFVLKPYVTGGYSDVYAVYVPYHGNNTFGIRNTSSSAYTWTVSCAVLYTKQ